MSKLKKGDITLAEMWALSKKVYKGEVDNKKKRMKMDIVSGKVLVTSNFEYDKNARQWIGTGKRHVKFQFLIKSKPVSYKKEDTIAIHKFICTFVFYDWGLGIRSPFKYRSGGMKKFLPTPKGSNKEKRIKIANQNIMNMTDIWFLMNLEYVLKAYGLLYGPCRANRPPLKTNKGLTPYFEKHGLACVEMILIPILRNPSLTGKILSRVTKNEKS